MKIHNTMTRTKEELEPIVPGEIGLYSCGVTVYDLSHVGHARSSMAFDMICRYLRFRGYRVTFVRNFTDIDDKIIRRATQEGVSWREVADKNVEAYREDMDAIGVQRADIEPRATDHVPEMVAHIERLIASGHAYVVAGGDVYFAVSSFPAYGRLSGKNLDDLLAGARVEVDERKRDPRDFALWKAAKPGEPNWPSPWGQGRPGWHIECSVMAIKHLGETFDIHGGGEDLIFPHHECEIAQSEAVTGKPFAHYWLHNGMVNLRREKMSKSLGNTLTIRNLAEHFHPDALRYYLLRAHYRNPLEFSRPGLDEAGRAIARMRILILRAVGKAREEGIPTKGATDVTPTYQVVEQRASSIDDPELREDVFSRFQGFIDAMDDDFNTPEAFGELFRLSSSLFEYSNRVERAERDFSTLLAGVDVLWMLGQSLGLFYHHVDPYVPSPEKTAEINTRDQAAQLAFERDAARRSRDWARADELRRQLESLGAKVEDTPSGTRLVWSGD